MVQVLEEQKYALLMGLCRVFLNDPQKAIWYKIVDLYKELEPAVKNGSMVVSEWELPSLIEQGRITKGGGGNADY